MFSRACLISTYNVWKSARLETGRVVLLKSKAASTKDWFRGVQTYVTLFLPQMFSKMFWIEGVKALP